MLTVSPSIRIPCGEISFTSIRASGPGGQHVNKTSTAIQLRFHIERSPSLPGDVKRRLMNLAGRRVTSDGELIIDARRFRSQDANRRDALERLHGLLVRASRSPRVRRRTAVPEASRRRRLHVKRLRAQVKKLRGHISADE